jgi:hypothetical protein
MATKNSNSKFLGVLVEDEMKDRVAAIAAKHGLSTSEVVRRFLVAGIEANPISETEVARVRATRSRRGQGLVIPLAPVASATPAADVTGAADENMEKMGIERRLLRSAPRHFARAA